MPPNIVWGLHPHTPLWKVSGDQAHNISYLMQKGDESFQKRCSRTKIARHEPFETFFCILRGLWCLIFTSFCCLILLKCYETP